jgi:hypothetical protein
MVMCVAGQHDSYNISANSDSFTIKNLKSGTNYSVTLQVKSRMNQQEVTRTYVTSELPYVVCKLDNFMLSNMIHAVCI